MQGFLSQPPILAQLGFQKTGATPAVTGEAAKHKQAEELASEQ